MIEFLTILILLFGLLNIIRLTVFMLAADTYDIKNKKKYLHYRVKKYPSVSVLIPAYNEVLTIEKTVKSVVAAKYPRKQIVVIDDGSSDATAQVVTKLIKRYPRTDIKLIIQENAGKGAALNRGIKVAKGELVMVLDADATIDVDALKNCIKYFDDPKIKAIASSVGLEDNGRWLGLLQRIEYLMSYRMKRSLTALNIEYIIGGVGSVYRLSTLKQVSGYRLNTITEDIDLSMKVVARGNRAYRVAFASDVRTKTEPVHSFKELIGQRYRWKLGRLQSFVRYRHMFFSSNKKYGKMLSWFQLPYALFGELYLLIEPIFIGTIIFVTFAYGDTSSIPIALLIMSSFMAFNIIATEDEGLLNKLGLLYLVPVIYFMLPILAYIELVSLIKSIVNWRKISPETSEKGHWTHVKRKPIASSS